MVWFRGQDKALAIAAILLGMTVTAKAGDGRMLYASIGDVTRAPIGWVEFCADTPTECPRGASQPRDIVLSQTDGYGDCEDYVLMKRKMLIDAGWPREALLITVVRDKNDEGHAVLTVKTDKGEFILDNQNENVVPWTETGYHFIKRQSQSDPNVWVALGDNHPAVATASAR
jgi:predicted transglutaminase-like cysteine proteinase